MGSNNPEGCDLIVNATPIGMDAVVVDLVADGAEVLPVPGERLGPGQLVADLVYQPQRTPRIDEARRRGATAVNGLGMLLHQAALSFQLWTGEKPPLEVMSAAAVAELTRRSSQTGANHN